MNSFPLLTFTFSTAGETMLAVARRLLLLAVVAPAGALQLHGAVPAAFDFSLSGQLNELAKDKVQVRVEGLDANGFPIKKQKTAVSLGTTETKTQTKTAVTQKAAFDSIVAHNAEVNSRSNIKSSTKSVENLTQKAKVEAKSSETETAKNSKK